MCDCKIVATAPSAINRSVSRYGTGRLWWEDAQRRLSDTTARRVEIAINAADVIIRVARVDDPAKGFMAEWIEDYKGAMVYGEFEAVSNARIAICVFAREHGWSLVDDNAYSQVFERTS